MRFCTAASAPAGNKTETLRERGAAAAWGVGVGVKPEVGTGEELVGRGEDGEASMGEGVRPEVGTGEGLAASGENGEAKTPGLKVTGGVCVAVGTSTAGDLVCTDGDATAGVVGTLGEGVVVGEDTAPGCVLAGCPYAAGATAPVLVCVTGSALTVGSTLEDDPLLGA